jgi:hypothetical protein
MAGRDDPAIVDIVAMGEALFSEVITFLSQKCKLIDKIRTFY